MNALPAVLKNKYTFEEYVALEQEGEVRHEFHDGVLVPLQATTKNHNIIVTNFFLLAEVHKLRKSGCQIFHENVITEVKENKRGVYPDIVITCAPKDRDHPLVVKHPMIIVEVLSKSTASYDKAGKFFKYQRIPSLLQYILISQYTHAIEFYSKKKNGQWIYKALDKLDDLLEIPSLHIRMKLEDLYADVTFVE